MPKEVWGLFTIRVLSGCLLGWISFRYSPANDYWSLLNESKSETELLKADPLRFVTSLVDSPYENAYGHFFNAVGSYWNDLRNNLIQKCLAILNLLSGGNYYLNSIFFNAFGFMGHVAFYRLFTGIFPHRARVIFWGTFFIPSTLYFSSGIHKDLVVFALVGFFLWNLYQWFEGDRKWKNMTVVFISLLGLVLMRNYLILILIPAFVGYAIALRSRKSIRNIYAIMLGLMLIGLFIVEQYKPHWTPLRLVQERQADFQALRTARSEMELTPLQPTLSSFIRNAPEALSHVSFRPTPFESRLVFTLALSIELWLVWGLMIYNLINRKRRSAWSETPFLGMILFITISLWILFGYICPNYHTLARYRSLYYILLIPSLLVFVKVKRKKVL